MRRTSIVCLLSLAMLVGIIPGNARAAEGDQIFDGISETALITRYLFNGNTEDRSSNSFYASLQGQKAEFVQNEQFGKVLSLPGGAAGDWIQIPSQAFKGVESPSVTGWIHIKDAALKPFCENCGCHSVYLDLTLE